MPAELPALLAIGREGIGTIAETGGTIMAYKGYSIDVYWTNKDWGFRFKVYDPNGKAAAESEAAYFYEDNALTEAKKIVDGLAGGEA